MNAPPTAIAMTKEEMKNCTSAEVDSVFTRVGSGGNGAVVLHMPVDRARPDQQTIDGFLDLTQRALHLPPLRHHLREQLMALAAGVAVCGQGSLLCDADRIRNRLEHVAHGRVRPSRGFSRSLPRPWSSPAHRAARRRCSDGLRRSVECARPATAAVQDNATGRVRRYRQCARTLSRYSALWPRAPVPAAPPGYALPAGRQGDVRHASETDTRCRGPASTR